MTAKRYTDVPEVLTHEHAKRKAIVIQMLYERDQRQPVSRDEVKRMRAEGRH